MNVFLNNCFGRIKYTLHHSFHFLIHACDELSPEPDQGLLHIPIRRHQRQSLAISISHENSSYQAGRAGGLQPAKYVIYEIFSGS